MNPDQDADIQVEDNKNHFLNYLQLARPSEELERIVTVADEDPSKPQRFVVESSLLRSQQQEFHDRVMHNPNDYLPDFRAALREAILDLAEEKGVDLRKKVTAAEHVFQVGFDGTLGKFNTDPRGLGAEMLKSMVKIDGIVTKRSRVQPKLAKSAHFCEETGRTMHVEYRDALTSDARNLPTGSTYPTKDAEGNLLSTDFGHSVYFDHQMISIQEMPERSPAGQLPSSVDVVLDHDLVDSVKPGDRISVIGVYRALPNKRGISASGVFRTVVIANNVSKLKADTQDIKVSRKDLENIRQFSKMENPLRRLSQSVAPSIYGHDEVKEALLLVLLGGMEKNLPNGTHLRGDINLLMVGDPSTAKSQLLRFVLHIAPLAINTTGRGSSGVGLTAAIGRDAETGDKVLEAGAMVLADRGVVCIDEFDKMNDADRTAIHEVMEQQTVTIAKAGIHATLNARCSVIAAANPVYGRYDARRNAEENVDLPDSLLSRFDFLFIVLDEGSSEKDTLIAEHVLRMHRYTNPDGTAVDNEIDDNIGIDENADDGADDEDDENKETPMYQSFDSLGRANSRKSSPLSVAFLKKYIRFAKTRIKPKMGAAAERYIREQFCALRDRSDAKTSPVTNRTVEVLIRAATAVARARLSNEVSLDDAEEGFRIVSHALFNDATGRPDDDADKGKGGKQQRRPGDDGSGGPGGGDDDGDSDDDSDDGNYDPASGSKKKRKRKSATGKGKGKGKGKSKPTKKRRRKEVRSAEGGEEEFDEVDTETESEDVSEKEFLAQDSSDDEDLSDEVFSDNDGDDDDDDDDDDEDLTPGERGARRFRGRTYRALQRLLNIPGDRRQETTVEEFKNSLEEINKGPVSDRVVQRSIDILTNDHAIMRSGNRLYRA